MKKTIIFPMLTSLVYMLQCCNERSESPCQANLIDTYVIGFDQCLAGLETNMGKGFLLATGAGDTVMTYNLPDSVFSFPKELFKNWWASPFFPDTAQSQYKVSVKYRLARPDELVSVACPGYVIFSPVTARAKQVVLVCAQQSD